MVNAEMQQRVQTLARQFQAQGVDLGAWLSATGQSPQEFFEGSRPQAEQAVKADLALRAVAVAEGFEVSDEELCELRQANRISSAAIVASLVGLAVVGLALLAMAVSAARREPTWTTASLPRVARPRSMSPEAMANLASASRRWVSPALAEGATGVTEIRLRRSTVGVG